MKEKSWIKVFDEEQKSNYAYKNDQWVGFDDIYSMDYKVLFFLSELKYLFIYFNKTTIQ